MISFNPENHSTIMILCKIYSVIHLQCRLIKSYIYQMDQLRYCLSKQEIQVSLSFKILFVRRYLHLFSILTIKQNEHIIMAKLTPCF